MDRQSLLAFLLIGIIIVFYPWYMSLVSPVDVNVSDEYVLEQNQEVVVIDTPPQEKKQIIQYKDSSPLQDINVKTNLYDLTITNKNGGSLVSYSLYNFTDHNGKLVNLIDELNSDNLSLGFISIDGDKTTLDHNWSSSNTFKTLRVDRGQKTLSFTTSHKGQAIKKTFTFYPDSYNIDVNIIVQQPKIKKYSNQMKKMISKLCNLSQDQINIKGKTTEKLGLIGKGEAIASEAITSVIKYD